jgi:integrase
MAKSTTDRLQRRGNRWYLNLGIPRSLRQYFLSSTGKPLAQIQQPLGDLTFEEAKIECSRRTTRCLELFARLRAGVPMTPAQIKAALLDPDPEAWSVEERAEARARYKSYMASAPFMAYAEAHASAERAASPAASVPAVVDGELISQAAEAWIAELQRDPSAAVKATTVDGHRLRVRAFVQHCGDVPLASVTRATASNFLDKIAAGGLANRTVNNYATTMACVFRSAKDRGRVTGDNPFERMKRKAGGGSYEAFTPGEIQTLFAALPAEIRPKRHTPESALPWVSRIGAYTGARLEEIAQLTAADIRDVPANGATVTVLDIHNGGNNTLKNESSARLVPVHSELVRAGLLDYAKALPEGSPLFPGLKRRESKGGKVGARLGELFRKRLVVLDIKRPGLCFHSLRHTVAGRLEAAGVSQTDAARCLGHAISGESYGTYSTGPGLKRLAAVVEAIEYPGH